MEREQLAAQPERPQQELLKQQVPEAAAEIQTPKTDRRLPGAGEEPAVHKQVGRTDWVGHTVQPGVDRRDSGRTDSTAAGKEPRHPWKDLPERHWDLPEEHRRAEEAAAAAQGHRRAEEEEPRTAAAPEEEHRTVEAAGKDPDLAARRQAVLEQQRAEERPKDPHTQRVAPAAVREVAMEAVPEQERRQMDFPHPAVREEPVVQEPEEELAQIQE